MDVRGIAARIHDLPALQRRALIGIIIAAAVGVAWLSLEARIPDAPIALWWPAIGLLFGAVLASRGHRLAVSGVVVAAVTVGNVVGGLPVELALAYGFANAIEVWIIVRLLTRGAAHASFSTLAQIGRFLLIVVFGVVVFSLIASTSAALLAGADPLLVASSIATSHASALFAVAPLFLVSLSVPRRFPLWEPVVQGLALVFLTVVVFTLAGALALTFLIITTLMWGAYRLPPLFVALQTIALALAATLATAADIGPFAVLLATDPRGAIFAFQLFIMTHAAAGLFVSGQRADWNATLEALALRERDATVVAEGLRQLNVQKDDFISAVSHELRTPVTSILGFSEVLIEGPLDAEAEQAGRIIHRNARRLADVIEDVLELSRMSTTEGSNRPHADVDVGRLVQNCVDDTVGLGQTDREVHVDLRVPAHPVLIRAVAQDLVRIVSNLVSNALKFSPPGGVVTVTLTEYDDSIELAIADDGPGIPLAEQEAVWERFYRVQTARHRDVPGTGLGLPIVRTLVEDRVGGTVSLVSDGEHGVTVVVSIPRTLGLLVEPSQSSAATAS